jgi:hypothetical protein
VALSGGVCGKVKGSGDGRERWFAGRTTGLAQSAADALYRDAYIVDGEGHS